MDLITVARFQTSIDAHLAKVQLEGEDITCYVFDEHTVDVNPLFSNAIGGVRLKVREEDAKRAAEIIDRINHKPYQDKQGNDIHCPNCESTRLYSDFNSMKHSGSFFAAITSIIFGAFPIYRKRVYRCKECDTEFHPDKPGIAKEGE